MIDSFYGNLLLAAAPDPLGGGAQKRIFLLILLAVILLFLARYLYKIAEYKSRAVRWMIPFHRRRPVPWSLGDAILIGIFFISVPAFFYQGYHAIPEEYRPVLEWSADSSETGKEADLKEDRELSKAHPLTQILVQIKSQGNYGLIFFLCFFTGVIAAPITEEFVFRVVLQGALEKYFHSAANWGRSFYIKGRIIGTILIPALFFAFIHIRSSETASDPNALLAGILIMPFAHLFTMIFAICWLKLLYGARFFDFGFSLKHFGSDFLKGVLVFFCLLTPLFLLQFVLRNTFPDQITDPIPIFVLAVALGIHYWFSHRIASIIAIHFMLNFCSFAAIFLAASK
ncbi:MAG: CPBP family intramembrane metalloprotease [Planctomycetia bacterium]|nr:CPBP family intramembrane metalloprotease [Planctomycetia bacterium]